MQPLLFHVLRFLSFFYFFFIKMYFYVQIYASHDIPHILLRKFARAVYRDF